jgi:hypothetical protein
MRQCFEAGSFFVAILKSKYSISGRLKAAVLSFPFLFVYLCFTSKGDPTRLGAAARREPEARTKQKPSPGFHDQVGTF